MRFLIFCAATFIAVAAAALPSKSSVAYTELEVETPQVTIVMEDAIMMLVTTDGTVGTITNVTVSGLNGEASIQLSGCGASTCRFNLSSLSSGTYNVQVNTSSGQSFSGSVNVGS